MNENTFAPFSCTLSTNSTISFVFPDTEDIITIGMRGDGDEAMSEDTNVN